MRLALLCCFIAACCGDAHSIAAPCGGDSALPAGFGVAIVSPALECASHLCLVGEGQGAVCTVECDSDGDCAGMARADCPGGYVCATVGSFPHSTCVCVESPR